MQLMDVGSVAGYKPFRICNTLAVDHTKNFSFFLQDKLPLRILLQTCANLLPGSSRMLPAKFFKMPKSLQVAFSRVPDDVLSLCEIVQADLTWFRCLWIAPHATFIKQTCSCRQCYEGFGANQILMCKTMDPIKVPKFAISPFSVDD